MRLLARREHAPRELVAKLRAKGATAAIAERVVGGLDADGLVSVRRFAEALIAARVRRGYGPVRVERDLKEQGLERDAIAEHLRCAGVDWAALAIEQRCKRFGARAPTGAAEAARQRRFLQYRGFTADQIRRALNSTAPE